MIDPFDRQEYPDPHEEAPAVIAAWVGGALALLLGLIVWIVRHVH